MFKRFKEHADFMFKAPLLAAVQCKFLMLWVGDKGRHIYSTRDVTVEEKKNLKTYEPRHDKTCFCHMRTTKAQISLRLISAFVFRCLDSIIPLLAKSKTSGP